MNTGLLLELFREHIALILVVPNSLYPLSSVLSVNIHPMFSFLLNFALHLDGNLTTDCDFSLFVSVTLYALGANMLSQVALVAGWS